MELGTIITILLPVLTGFVGYIIKKFGADKVIGDMANEIDENAERLMDVQDAVSEAFKPDESGEVRLTGDEVRNIYDSIDDLLDGFGIDLPDWPGTE